METKNFYLLFVALLGLLAVEPFLSGAPRSGAWIQLAYTTVVLVGAFGFTADRRAFALGIGLAVIGLAAALGFYWTDALALRVVDLLAILCFCLLAIAVNVRQVIFVPGAVTLNRVVGGLCIYLLLGVTWAVLNALVQLVEPAAFSSAGSASGDPIENVLYYSFVTLTTLGYGDMIPVHPVARTLAYLEAVVGQIYLVVLIAALVGRYISERGTGAGA